MNILESLPVILPDVIFLDLNMPLKNGFQCLKEIKMNGSLKQLPVIIFSTTIQAETVDKVYKDGASFYMRKPEDFNQLKKDIKKALSIHFNPSQTPKDQFILSAS